MTENSKVDTTKLQVLSDFMAKAQKGARMNSKEMRLSMMEAFELAAAIGQVLSQNVMLNTELRAAEALINGQMRVDGGGFR